MYTKTNEEGIGCATIGRAHSDHSSQDIKRHEHKKLARRILPAEFIEGEIPGTLMKSKIELVIDNSFPTGLETPEELLQ